MAELLERWPNPTGEQDDHPVWDDGLHGNETGPLIYFGIRQDAAEEVSSAPGRPERSLRGAPVAVGEGERPVKRGELGDQLRLSLTGQPLGHGAPGDQKRAGVGDLPDVLAAAVAGVVPLALSAVGVQSFAQTLAAGGPADVQHSGAGYPGAVQGFDRRGRGAALAVAGRAAWEELRR